MLKTVDSLSSEGCLFVLASELSPEDLVGKYILPAHDLRINIVLENVQLRDSFEGKVYEQLLPFQKFCIDYYKKLAKLDVNSFNLDGTVVGYGFVLYDPVTKIEYYTLHNWQQRKGVNGVYLEPVLFENPIPGTETNALIPSNIALNSLTKPYEESVVRNEYIKTWRGVSLNPFEYGVYMDKTFYSKTPFHIRNYFQNGGKSLNQMIDNDLYR